MLITHIPAGYLADRFGRKPVLVAAWGTGLLATWVMALARSLPVFVLGMLLYGFTAFVSSPLNSYVTAARGKLSLARAMTLSTAAYNLGAVFGPISGGWIGERLGLRSVYLVSACIFIVSTAIVLFLRPQPREIHDPAASPEKLWQNRRFVSFLGITFLAIFFMYLPQPLTPTFLQNERGLSLQNIGLLGSIGSLGNTLLALLLGQFSARIGFLLAKVSVAAFALLLWKGTGLPWYTLGFFLLGGYRSARSLVFAQVRPLIHSARMGLAYGVVETFSSLAIMLAPLLSGVLYRACTGDGVLGQRGVGGRVFLSGIYLKREQIRDKVPAISFPPEIRPISIVESYRFELKTKENDDIPYSLSFIKLAKFNCGL